MKHKQLAMVIALSLAWLLAAWAALSLSREAQAAGPERSWLKRYSCLLGTSFCQAIEPVLNPASQQNQVRIQATVSLTPSKDNSLIEDNEGDLSNGAGQNFFAGRVGLGGGGLARRGVIAFDLANSGIPTNSVIVSVTLRLNMSQSASGPQTVALHRLLSNWGQGTSVAPGSGGTGAPATTGDATWLHTFFNTNFWTTPGGDFSSTASASTSVGEIGIYTWSTSQMVTDVQNWLHTPAANFGWLVLGNESAAGTAKRFDSRENTTPANRPTLIIDYAPIVDTDYLPIIQKKN